MIYRFCDTQKRNFEARRLNQADMPGFASNLFDSRSGRRQLLRRRAAACMIEK
jgi:hypothetical protein